MTNGGPREDSVLGYLAARFTTQRENLATEALAYVLRRSPSGRRGFATVVASTGAPHPESLDYRTQVVAAEDDSIPDLVGIAPDGRTQVIVEAKFWAALTPNQPATYLQRLEPRGLLLFVAPARRMEVLWQEITRRAGGRVTPSRSVGDELFATTLADDRVLALVSWRALLAIVRGACEAAGDDSAVADITQLAGFANAMDANAFLPLEPGELTGNLGQRVVDFCGLVDDLASELLADGRAHKQGLRSAAGAGWYGQYLNISGWGCLLQCNAHYWGRQASTPLWLQVKDHTWKTTQLVTDTIAPLTADPCRAFLVNDQWQIALYPPESADRAVVVDEVGRQIRDVVELIQVAAAAHPPEIEDLPAQSVDV